MCGIIGAISSEKILNILTTGLKNLEYRGYDSAGFAISSNNKLLIHKDKGYVSNIISSFPKSFSNTNSKLGIAHTRWATHGKPNKLNAHPHFNSNKTIAIVHNGIIENYNKLKLKLMANKYKFYSQTDSEVIAKLLDYEFKKTKNFEIAFKKTISQLKGQYAILAISSFENKLFCAKNKSPLVLAKTKSGFICSSDASSISQFSTDLYFLKDGDIICLEQSKLKPLNQSRILFKHYDANNLIVDKQGFKHFTKKEIFDQLTCLPNLFKPINLNKKLIGKAKHIHLIACGSSYFSANFFQYVLAQNKKTAHSFIASEYMDLAVPDNSTLVIAISQSGETADTLNAVRFAKSHGAKIIGITNTLNSSLDKLSDTTINLNAGPEIAVVSTKTFTSQLLVLLNIAGHLNPLHKKVFEKYISQILKTTYPKIKTLARLLFKKGFRDFFFISRGLGFPIAQEASLKLKEITYLHAEAYPAGELKHGPLSLLDKRTCVISILTDDNNFNHMLSSINEVKSRGAFSVVISDQKINSTYYNKLLKINVPKNISIPEFYVGATLIFQILAYEMAVLMKQNPDRPRNLAKSVTVE